MPKKSEDTYTTEEILVRIEVFKMLERGVNQRAVAEVIGSNQTAVSRMFGEHVRKHLSEN